jgi:type IV secretory pathway VirJ component
MHKYVTIVMFAVTLAVNAQAIDYKFRFGAFDTVTVYKPASGDIQQVTLFISGDGGWNLGVVDMARELLPLNVLVVGVDIRHYLRNIQATKDKCLYPAADFELLSKFVQKKENLPAYILPIIVGYSSGATLAYAIIAQSPVNTFKGAISMGFCPDLPLVKPLCAGSGGLASEPGPKGKGFSFLPLPTLPTPWIAFQGKADQVCDPAAVEQFVKQIRSARLVSLEKVGHGFSVEKNWLSPFKQSFTAIAANTDPQKPITTGLTKKADTTLSKVEPVSDLPIVEVPVQGIARDVMAIILTGDGGWAGIDKEIADALSTRGIPVVGLNSLKYFWNKHTPDETTHDVERIMHYYMTAWNKKNIILIGYSFGADVLPFVGTRLSADYAQSIKLYAYLGLSKRAEFQFHASDWLGGKSTDTLPVLPEIEKLKGKNMMYFYGAEEKETVADEIDKKAVRTIMLPGGHHFGGHYDMITDSIIAAVN